MHTLVILLTKAEDKEEAISNCEEFLEQYGEGDVWDWYVIGGRWDNYLSPQENTEENTYNVLPLADCLEIVRENIRDMAVIVDKCLKDMLEAIEKEKKGEDGISSAYYASLYSDAKYNNFSFDSMVYDITTEEGEILPANTEGYWAIVIDLHN